MFGCIGLHLGPVQTDGTQFQHPHLMRDLKNLHKDLCKFRQESPTEGAMVSWSGWVLAAMYRNATES